MQYVLTLPSSWTTTWLCSHVIAGSSFSTICRERRPIFGISSSTTLKFLTMR
jgi:hypothetical protein